VNRRRTLLTRVGIIATVCLLPACADDDPTDQSPSTTPDAADTGVQPDTAIGSDASTDTGADVTGDTADATEPDPGPDTCEDNQTFFEDRLWEDLLNPVCLACHADQGIARDSALSFRPSAQADYLEANYTILANVAQLEIDGTSLVLLKPSGTVEHGGGTVAPDGSEAYELLTEFVARLADPVECDDNGEIELPGEGLILRSELSTLRAATLNLTGRLPTSDEYRSVQIGGEEAVREVVWDAMDEDAFFERLKELYNDHFLPRRYEAGNDGVELIDYERFPNAYFYEAVAAEDGSARNRWRSAVSSAVANEPLELVVHIVREGLPFTEVLTADYAMVNGFTAAAYGLDEGAFELYGDEEEAAEFFPAQIPDFNHAGVLSMTAMLNRFPTTDTNRNRHRSWIIFRLFLASDILGFADRPIDPSSSTVHNPTLNDPQCTVCHTTMDPVAGLLQNWDSSGRYRPPADGWYPSLAPPGFGDEVLPVSERPRAAQWLAERIAVDRRFALSQTELVFSSVTGIPVRSPVNRVDSAEDEVARAAYRTQQDEFERIATLFVESDYNLRVLFVESLLSPYYRAVGVGDEESGGMIDAGSARLRTPEQLDRQILAVTGYPWARSRNNTPYLLSTYLLLYGGIDSNAISERANVPSGIISNIGLRAATDIACVAVARDFVLNSEDRRLFPFVEMTFAPETLDGFHVPDAERSIRENIAYLHWRMLGEELAIDSAEVDATFALFEGTWREGREKIGAGELPVEIVSACRATSNWYTGENISTDRRIQNDPDYIIRAWQAVYAYLATDYRFIYE
jgi:hypothetical protein